MKSITKPLKDIREHIIDQVLWNELWPLKCKIEKFIIAGEIKDEFWNDQDVKHSYEIDVDNRDMRLFLLDLMRQLDRLEDEIDTVMEKNRVLIYKTEKQGKTK